MRDEEEHIFFFFFLSKTISVTWKNILNFVLVQPIAVWLLEFEKTFEATFEAVSYHKI